MLTMLDVELTERALQEAINFLVKGWCHGIARNNNQFQLPQLRLNILLLGSCCAQVLWIRNQLRDYGIVLEKIPIMCDNTSAISIVANPVDHSRTKHIDIRYHFIREHALKGTIILHYVPTTKQLDDIFTKPLDEATFNRLVSEIGMLNSSS